MEPFYLYPQCHANRTANEIKMNVNECVCRTVSICILICIVMVSTCSKYFWIFNIILVIFPDQCFPSMPAYLLNIDLTWLSWHIGLHWRVTPNCFEIGDRVIKYTYYINITLNTQKYGSMPFTMPSVYRDNDKRVIIRPPSATQIWHSIAWDGYALWRTTS